MNRLTLDEDAEIVPKPLILGITPEAIRITIVASLIAQARQFDLSMVG